MEISNAIVKAQRATHRRSNERKQLADPPRPSTGGSSGATAQQDLKVSAEPTGTGTAQMTGNQKEDTGRPVHQGPSAMRSARNRGAVALPFAPPGFRAHLSTKPRNQDRHIPSRQRQLAPVDPDFDRSLPILLNDVNSAQDPGALATLDTKRPTPATKPIGKLFNPSTDAVPMMKRAHAVEQPATQEDKLGRKGSSRKRGDKSREGSGKERSRSERKKVERKDSRLWDPETTRPGTNSTSSGLLQHMVANSDTNREGGKIFLLKKSDGTLRKSDDVDQNLHNGDESVVKRAQSYTFTHDQMVTTIREVHDELSKLEGHVIAEDAKRLREDFEGDEETAQVDHAKWQALAAAHTSLAHVYYAFLSTSQHPAAGVSIRRLASKHAIPGRLWRHAILSLLELFRHRLPALLEHMLSFLYFAYDLMTTLLETIPIFRNTWLECLGDLARYRMAIEENVEEDRETWRGVARMWYYRASKKEPAVGRLYHHLAVLVPPGEGSRMEQLFYYSRSLIVAHPFSSSRESMLALFNPEYVQMQMDNSLDDQPASAKFSDLHRMLFGSVQLDDFELAVDDLVALLDEHQTWQPDGTKMAIANIAALFQYGKRDSVLRRLVKEGRKERETEIEISAVAHDLPGSDEVVLPTLTAADNENQEHLAPFGNDQGSPSSAFKKLAIAEQDENTTVNEIVFQKATQLLVSVLTLALTTGTSDVYPHVHVMLTFFTHVLSYHTVASALEDKLPWEAIAYFLTDAMQAVEDEGVVGAEFPQGAGTPLAEDWVMRGMDWSRKMFPSEWFNDFEDEHDVEERCLDDDDDAEAYRTERIAWLALRLCRVVDALQYHPEKREFSVSETFLLRKQVLAEAATLESFRDRTTSAEDVSDDDDYFFDADGQESDEELNAEAESEELRELKQRRRELKAMLSEQRKPVRDRAAATTNTIGQDKDVVVKPGQTKLIFDTNLLVSNLDLFKLALQTGNWTIIVPLVVITELDGLKNNPPPLGDAARDAIHTIEAALAAWQLKVLTARGNALTNLSFRSEQLDEGYATTEERRKTLDDRIIDAVRAQLAVGPTNDEVEKAVLVTGDRNMRVIAKARGVTPITGAALSKIMSGDASATSSKRSRKKRIDGT
ncbi:hypothetical protein SAICODRAFT_5582 [Saitoella complicata NRRL Y-17804]|uniref:PIN domain-containing protein n=1 Tax=Saitoella complicata (strain BCRC 22490 / CBS 7301 / JCM 7358 / NBRC 10748 / NRRL Y-17804) TaxID=698492 RepID=A0A0E9NKF6_SAICN|nr:uncharacterized protein SAICODRAFT_5582 [Saitoella complicata NRRL Y-17804]ODQ54961.1 hypothetical protein SAICODRAFT_5582 [Saitoella complicata NRRL Y-17804]GAO49865.1 hypothetical protein G7K_4002-t1 [Saitoella complicata NRRL Y-17804]